MRGPIVKRWTSANTMVESLIPQKSTGPESSLLGWISNWADGISLGLIELHKLGEIELWLLEDLDLLDENILEWEDFVAG